MKVRTVFYFCSFFLLTGCSLFQDGSKSEQEPGVISFPTSASGEAQHEFLKGITALHDFWYPQARDHFKKARELDTDFAMAYWGEVMTYDRPLWGQHDHEEGNQVLSALDQKIEEGTVQWSEREQAYLDAARLLFETGPSMANRRDQFASAMQELAERYPDDQEAVIFASLAEMSVSGFDFESDSDVDPVASRLEDVLERNPNHPGALHYLIHVCDTEKFARRALPAAEKYLDIAVSSHAIHMGSHIFRHLGMWEKVVEVNIAAYTASVEWQQETERPLRARDFHAFDWLFDGYMRLGSYEEACKLLDELDQLIAEADDRGEDHDSIIRAKDRSLDQYRNQAEAPACR
ncbi:MAG TPA: hypothetical protein VK074_14110 [Fodinibius sp.]|nr:hypothetical protein [Fodinibius sp.]